MSAAPATGAGAPLTARSAACGATGPCRSAPRVGTDPHAGTDPRAGTDPLPVVQGEISSSERFAVSSASVPATTAPTTATAPSITNTAATLSPAA